MADSWMILGMSPEDSLAAELRDSSESSFVLLDIQQTVGKLRDYHVCWGWQCLMYSPSTCTVLGACMYDTFS